MGKFPHGGHVPAAIATVALVTRGGAATATLALVTVGAAGVSVATGARGGVPFAEGASRLATNQEEGGGASLREESAGFYCEGHLGEVRGNSVW